MNDIEKFYKSFGLDKTISKDFFKKQEINKLFQIPKKETDKEMPKFYNFQEDNTHQADILFLPIDKVSGKFYAYALIVVDLATGDTDGEPLKHQKGWKAPSSSDVRDAMIKIYKRRNLNKPKLLITDSGREFLDIPFQNYLEQNDIAWKKAIGARHRQVGMVERRNYTIGRAIMMRQFAESMITQKETVHWVKYFPELIAAVNERFSHDPYNDESLFKKFGDPWKEKQEILPLNTEVRIQLTQPKDYKERNIKGHFRAGDQRWSQDTYKIVGYVFDPHAPVMYKLNQKLKPHEHVAYTKKQLQVVAPDEEDVSAHQLGLKLKDTDEFAIKKLIDKRIRGRATEYLVQWRGFPVKDATWENKSNLPKNFVKNYENQIKK
jgi:hypothetical protein